MHSHNTPQNGAATSDKRQLTDAAADFRYLDRKQINTSQLLTNKEQTGIIAITRNGRKLVSKAPCFPDMSLCENLAWVYSSLKETGDAVIDLRAGRMKNGVQTCWVFSISEDPAAHRDFPSLWRGMHGR